MSYLTDPMARYKSRVRAHDRDPLSDYTVLGYIAAGTYGRVYKAQAKESGKVVAIKKFKADKEGERTSYYVGLSQSAYREMALCRELHHPSIVELVDTVLYDKSIYLVFDYAEHDLLQLIRYHCTAGVKYKRIAPSCVKSILYQVLRGVAYLHENWVLHRDLKPANIMITSRGVVKVGDLGLARIFREPLQSLYTGDKIVVTIWYRAIELLLGSRHYTPAIDIWAIGCIFAEMLSLRPIFKGEEAVTENEKAMSFQRDQVEKLTKILGTPTPEQWKLIAATPDYKELQSIRHYKWCLNDWHRHFDPGNPQSLALLSEFFNYDPDARISALAAMEHPYFTPADGTPLYKANCFENQPVVYQPRRVAANEVNMKIPPASSHAQTMKRPTTTQGSAKKKSKN